MLKWGFVILYFIDLVARKFVGIVLMKRKLSGLYMSLMLASSSTLICFSRYEHIFNTIFLIYARHPFVFFSF